MSANDKPNVPMPCKTGCGFFGSEATGGSCSKCWMETIKNKTTPAAPAIADVAVADASAKTASSHEPITKNTRELEKDSVVTPSLKQPVEESKTPAPAAVTTAPLKKKKKKKKTGYKSMMASMMVGTEKDIVKEKELLAKGLGGGNFSKIEKI